MAGRAYLFLIAIIAIASSAWPSQVQAQSVNTSNQRQFSPNSSRQFGGRTVSLEDQLKNGLRVARPEQLVFVKRVVNLVEDDRLPQAMVNLVYTWALEKNPKIPYPYFEFAMRELSKRRMVYIP